MMHEGLTEDFIRARAYSLWENDGRQHGAALHYWLMAEQAITSGAETAIDAPKAKRARRTAAVPAAAKTTRKTSKKLVD